MSQENATITLRVEIALERDPGLNTPNAWESAYDYLTLENVTVTDVELGSLAEVHPEGARHMAEDGIDPDGKIRDAITEALTRGGEAS